MVIPLAFVVLLGFGPEFTITNSGLSLSEADSCNEKNACIEKITKGRMSDKAERAASKYQSVNFPKPELFEQL